MWDLIGFVISECLIETFIFFASISFDVGMVSSFVLLIGDKLFRVYASMIRVRRTCLNYECCQAYSIVYCKLTVGVYHCPYLNFVIHFNSILHWTFINLVVRLIPEDTYSDNPTQVEFTSLRQYSFSFNVDIIWGQLNVSHMYFTE